jgi:hypothetical protein
MNGITAILAYMKRLAVKELANTSGTEKETNQ